VTVTAGDKIMAFSYRDYVADKQFMDDYVEYQKQYASTLRENDKAFIEHVRRLTEADLASGKPVTLYDLGCSAGNFLRHLKHALPGLTLAGGDAAADVVETCRRDPTLAGIEFDVMDALNVRASAAYDVITVCAVLFLFDSDEFDRALASIASALKPGGWLVVYDFFHPFEQDLTVVEKSKTHPDGLTLHFRPFSKVRRSLEGARLANATLTPFEMPVDFEKPADLTDMRTLHGAHVSRQTPAVPWQSVSAVVLSPGPENRMIRSERSCPA
jgi:SAM-dependent methyltransferase